MFKTPRSRGCIFKGKTYPNPAKGKTNFIKKKNLIHPGFIRGTVPVSQRFGFCVVQNQTIQAVYTTYKAPGSLRTQKAGIQILAQRAQRFTIHTVRSN